jgi:hypothetical protein
MCRTSIFLLCSFIYNHIHSTLHGGPFDSDISSSSSSDLDNISAVNELLNNTFPFLHLNIQSIVSKIDMISAEYSCHDILSFTESWLNENTSTDQQCLEIPDYKFPPFRRGRSNKIDGGVSGKNTQLRSYLS